MERHIIGISGKDSLATALFQTAKEPEINYEYFFNDVKTELPETYKWLKLVEEKTGWKILRIGADLKAKIYSRKFLPSPKMRYCTGETKIAPMEDFFKGDKVTAYFGLRADENRVGKRPSDTMIHKYPLREAGIDLRGVWTILKYQQMLPPSFFFTELYYRVCEMLSKETLGYTALDQLEEWEFRILFAGRSRSNCYMCFFQRQYEYLWLSIYHPELFYETCKMERTIGGKEYTWREGFYLDEKIYKDRDKILNRRAKQIIKILKNRLNRGLFYQDYELESELSQTSCGLLCGK